ncbi:MAG: beta-propeller fold lactonase family protein [Terriglobales bacterium]
MNAETAQLRANGWVLVGTAPEGLTATPNGQFLYVANSKSNNVSAFVVNATNGSLTAAAGSPLASKTTPWEVATDPGSKFLYVANKGAGAFSG